jgi:hypothetical protein
MFPVNKDILILVSLACALIAIFYLYKDQQKTKLDVQKLSESATQAVVPPKPLPQPVQKKAPAPEITVADESN